MDTFFRFGLARGRLAPGRRSSLFGAFALSLSILLGACSSAAVPATAQTTSTTASATPVSIATATPTTAPSALASLAPSPTFPVTLTDDENNQVAVSSEPQRVVTLSPSATEIVFALGAGGRVVAVSDFSDYPPEAAKLPHVAKFDTVDVEKIVGSGADLVIAGGSGFNPPKDLAKLRSLKVPVLTLDAQGANGIDGVYHDIDLIGQAIGRPAEADALVQKMRTEMDTISAAAAPSGPRPKVFYETGYDPGTGQIFGVADKSFIAGMIQLAGGDPITTGSTSVWSMPLEKLIAADPDVIVIGDAAFGSTAASVAKRTGWNVMTAVRTKALREVTDTEISRPGPRLPIGLRNLALAINPKAQVPVVP